MKKRVEDNNEFKSEFEKLYISLRAKENRVYSDELVASLPIVKKDHDQYEEWCMRSKSASRLANYISDKKINNILELGCGNGWFSNLISNHTDAFVLGLDINKIELEQAKRVFKKKNLAFEFGDIFSKNFKTKFDFIILNASVQYFSDFSRLIDRLKEILNLEGEIHILDSPFYENKKEAFLAKNRSQDYYENQGFGDLSKYYFHHSKEHLIGFKLMYTPRKGIVKKIFGNNGTPFAWYRFIKKK